MVPNHSAEPNRGIRSLRRIVCVFFVAACVTAGSYGSTGTTQPNPTETYTNAPSKFRFPPRIGGFEREQVTQYDAKGHDVGVGYNELRDGIAVTVFVYPIA